MPGYGISDDPTGLLPWSWAEQRLTDSHNYWVGTVGRRGAPQAAVVWGIWLDERFWFSTGDGSRKARDLRADERCTVATEQAADALVVRGRAQVVTDRAHVAEVARRYRAKYGEGFPEDGDDPLFVVVASSVLATPEADFTRHPTRWRYVD